MKKKYDIGSKMQNIVEGSAVWFPWSEWICKGTSKIEAIFSTNLSATVLASASENFIQDQKEILLVSN
jgi:hypothetical protein